MPAVILYLTVMNYVDRDHEEPAEVAGIFQGCGLMAEIL
jgi:hypothetical protein